MKNKNVASRREARITFPTCPSREENDLDLVKISTFVWENEKMLEGENYNRNRFILYDEREISKTKTYNVQYRNERGSDFKNFSVKFKAPPSLITLLTYARGGR